MEDQECSCCISKFSVRRKPVICPKCGFKICNPCFERYTLDNLALDYIGTMCMSCKEPLSFDFITSNTTKSFVFKKWKDKRKEILIGIETAKLPATQNSANIYKEYKNNLTTIKKEIDRLKEELLKKFFYIDNEPNNNYYQSSSSSRSQDFPFYKIETLHQLYSYYDREWFYTNASDTEKKVYNKEKSKFYWKAYNESYELKNEINIQEKNLLEKKYDLNRLELLFKTDEDDTVELEEENKERRLFIMPCPLKDCKGFLSSGYKCGLCNGKICSKCHIELKSKDEEHICDKNMVESVKAINSDTRPCPKCGARIYKIDGCDQMWCLHCKTAFSWDTGKIVQGERIHNPEYFRWMREHQQEVPRVEDHIGCEDLPPYYKFDDFAYRGLISFESSQMLINLWRMVYHINEVEIPGRLMRINRDLRVKYLVNEIDMEKMRIQLMKRERFNMRNTFVIGMFRLIVDIISDKLRVIARTPSHDLVDLSIIELIELCRYVNTQMENFSKVHELLTPRFHDNANNLFEVVKRPRNNKKKSKADFEDEFFDDF